MVQINIKTPDKNTPGFARRLHRAAGFKVRASAGEFTPQLVEEMVEFLSDYIEGDKEQAKEYLWDCTEDQFNQMIAAVSGGSPEEIPPAEKSESTVIP